MKHRSTVTYRATFSQLRLHAFGIQQTIDYTGEIEIYQAGIRPPLWRARPTFRHGDHDWEARSAEDLMELIEADFEYVCLPWKPWECDDQMVRRPSLYPAPSRGAKSA